jgi:hypothetical protein
MLRKLFGLNYNLEYPKRIEIITFAKTNCRLMQMYTFFLQQDKWGIKLIRSLLDDVLEC